jgi:hypothetical protein
MACLILAAHSDLQSGATTPLIAVTERGTVIPHSKSVPPASHLWCVLFAVAECRRPLFLVVFFNIIYQ